ncbi:nuclear transport factor 2 family protein [Mycobacterium sp. CVI_P3]|uniref:Nuclear transport factor 2 family protein n=1 Tax=Mycobacterium pinniadriaticum TaxID=2994102 RepID=A0ABT3SMC9_9MYCO|nr:nuclear transport factor 2 family protein [Mycobacterium pinniadriaticum]MCX2934277.1 nuclear transport factor 2 family protein [Mycobacterium pinniadriaticum]MCX2940685.1 nuclear transport factor 2 family protein [Mycobacterium pinniadriaticum]
MDAIATNQKYESEVLHTVNQLFAALEAGDLSAAKALFHNNAVVWHNTDMTEQAADTALAPLGLLATYNARFDIVRRYLVEDGCIQQHTVRRTTTTGEILEVSAIQRICVDDGLISRIEEYLDTFQAMRFLTPDPLAQIP